jgi:hypothetical protein
MAKSHAIRALENQRASLRADIARHETAIAKAMEGIAHIEATLALLSDAKRKGAPNGRKRRWLFRYGELGQMIWEIEDKASKPLSCFQVAAAIMERKGWPADDQQLERLLAGKVRNARRLMRPRAANIPSTGG